METPSERLLQEFPPSAYNDWRQAALETLNGAPFEKKLLTPTYEGVTLQPIYAQPADSERERNLGGSQFSGDWTIAQDGPVDCVGLDPLGVLAADGTLPCSLDQAYAVMHRLTAWAQQHSSPIKTILVDSTPYHDSGAHAVQEVAFAMATGVEYLRAMLTRGLTIEERAPRMQFVFALGTQYFMEVAKLRAARLLWANVVKAFGGSVEAQNMAIHTCTGRWNTTVYDPYVNLLRATVAAFAGVVGGSDSVEVNYKEDHHEIHETHEQKHEKTEEEQQGQENDSFSSSSRVFRVFRGDILLDDFARRIARNTQLILKEEVHLDKVSDPAGGAWYVEQLTDELARAAWALFQEIERQGGMFKALEAGFPQEQVAQTAAQRLANLATRKDVLVGMNMYPNLLEEGNHETHEIHEKKKLRRAEEQKDRRAEEHDPFSFFRVFRVFRGSPLSPDIQEAIQTIFTEQAASQMPSPIVKPLQPHRAAEQFEALRLASDAYKAKTGNRPKVFMANMGPVAQHKARADFSIGFFEVGGFEMIPNSGFATVDDAVNAALTSDAPMVVICSTDATYPDIVPAFTRQIKAAKPEMIVILAGYPKDQVEAFKAAGVDEFIHLRANVSETLATLQDRLTRKL